MIYKSFQGKQLSALGLGCMRLPMTDGKIDKQQTAEMLAYAMQNGINYYDTAWGYHGGESETVMGELLSAYPRESFYLASKFPGYDSSTHTRVAEVFEEQLKKCRVEYFDFYLFHNVCESNIDAYLDDTLGIGAYLLDQKKNGRIKHLGFSGHGDLDVLSRFLAKYGKDMEFGQLQINYIDYTFQKGKEKMQLLADYNIPVWIMEPVRGGKLATMDARYAEKLSAFRPQETACGWAFRFLQSFPQITVTLSGMSNFEQLAQNIATFSEDKPLNEQEMTTLLEIANSMISGVPCTECRYCTTYCPQGLDIPKLIALYNEHSFTGGGFIAPMALSAIEEEKRPSACVGCRSCESVCPQNIKISEVMADFVQKLK
jgi:predicted aldo/keto reductase-like oxidoreductase